MQYRHNRTQNFWPMNVGPSNTSSHNHSGHYMRSTRNKRNCNNGMAPRKLRMTWPIHDATWQWQRQLASTAQHHQQQQQEQCNGNGRGHIGRISNWRTNSAPSTAAVCSNHRNHSNQQQQQHPQFSTTGAERTQPTINTRPTAHTRGNGWVACRTHWGFFVVV